ncbi:MAG: (d)CMP kinase [Ktedonobacteraceae bacterium]
MRRPACITIDGPAGAGKSTIGEQLARQLGYIYFDTGAMYRAVAWLALQRGVDIHDEAALAELTRHANITISHPHIEDGRQYTVTADGRDVTWEIRSANVANSVSIVATHPEVRTVLRARQRALAAQGGIVMVGRDIGAIVLPNADLKIYLTAGLQERARRRYAELVERMGAHNPALPDMDAVVQEIRLRDALDHDNMRPAPDAVIIDTDGLDVSQVLAVIDPHLERFV